MRRFIQILIGLFALAGVIAWTIFTARIWKWGHSFKGFGVGDGGAAESPSLWEQLLSLLLIAAVWLVPMLILAAIVWVLMRWNRRKEV